MVPLLTLASLLATGGEVPEPSATSSQPKVEILGPPVRGAVGIAGVGAYDFRFRTLGLVPGIFGELGVTLDRIGIVASVAGGTVAVMTVFAGGLRIDWDVDAVVRLGLGAEIMLLGMLEGPGVLSLGVPLSAGFLVWSQPRQGGGRHGLEVFLRAIPAVTLGGGAGGLGRGSFSPGPPFTVAGITGIGYSWR